MECIKVENLSFTYPLEEKPALDQVSFTIQAGEFIIICGETGCGKTTLLKLLKKELSPKGKKEGVVYYQGTPLEQLSASTAATQIGYVMQNPEGQIVTEKVWHELSFGLENIGVPSSVIRRRVGEMANFFGMSHWFRKKTANLSGGQKQLLNLASIMVMQPSVLILDEPTSQLDPIAASAFIATLKKLNQELGLTIILVEHRLEEVFPLADFVLVLEDGKKLLFDTPRNIGKQLKAYKQNHAMLLGLPSAVRIYQGLDSHAPCPLDVKEGRQFLSKYYRKDITSLPQKTTINTLPAISNTKKSPPPAIVLKDIWFRYERNLSDVMRGVSLTVETGEIFSILGGNGSGKTTTLHIMTGQLSPYKGKVMINGKNSKSYKKRDLYKNQLALLPQNPQTVFLKSTIFDDLEETCKTMSYNKEDTLLQIKKIAKQLDITGLLNKHPYDLSGGQQQKAALAKILLLNPKILLLDEPTKGIDACAKAALKEILLALKRQGITIVLVTHDIEFAAGCSDQCALFFDGDIISKDTPNVFFSNNNFYTTAANRMSRHQYNHLISCEEVIALCKENGAL